jgi:glycosyltransferase involved in cell wall biosynthesis
MKRLLFYSQYAFYKPLNLVFERVAADFGLERFVITHEKTPMPKVYAPAGYLTHASAGLADLPAYVTVIPKDMRLEEKTALLKKEVQRIRPDFIWAHEEPNNFFVNEILRWYRRRRTPRIVGVVVENLWPLPVGFRARWQYFRRRRLWRRFDGVLACASKSAEAIRAYGMPESVKILTGWLPTLSPEDGLCDEGVSSLPRRRGREFTVGFAGRITAAKGWRVLLAAMTELPEQIKCLIAGSGEEEAELRLWCQVPAIGCRTQYLGVLEKDRLWTFFRELDAFVLPSLTAPHWTEQFGAALAEAMACGVPVIGSASGAIPEVVGDCGIVVEENNPTALAQAIQTLASDPDRRARYAKAGRKRFEQEYSVRAYAAKVAEALGLKAGNKSAPST